MNKEFCLNLQNELKFHQKCMSHFKVLGKMQQQMDHGFFKNFVGSFVNKQKIFETQRSVCEEMVKDDNLSPREIIQKLEMQFYDEYMDGEDDEYESSGFDDAKSFIGSELKKIVPKESVKIL